MKTDSCIFRYLCALPQVQRGIVLTWPNDLPLYEIIQSVNPPSKARNGKVWVNLEQSRTKKWVMSLFLVVCQHDTRLFWLACSLGVTPSALHQMQSEYAIKYVRCSDSKLIRRCPIDICWVPQISICLWMLFSLVEVRRQEESWRIQTQRKASSVFKKAFYYLKFEIWFLEGWVRSLFTSLELCMIFDYSFLFLVLVCLCFV